MKFPFFDLTRQYQTLKEEMMPIVQRTFEKQAFVMGEEVTLLEKELAEFIGVKHAITCGSGTDALVLAMKAMGVKPGDEIMTPPFSFFASTSSILLCEALPVFVDVDPYNFTMDPKNLEKSLTKKTKGIMPVHLFGQCADMEPILAFAKKHGLFVLEDFAQSIGAKYNNKGAGSMGTMGATSFYPTKNLGGAGEGGLVTTDDDDLADRARLLRVHGMRVRYTHEILGWNSRLDALQAAILRVKLRHLNKWVTRRRDLAEQYRAILSVLETRGNIQLPKEQKGNFHVWNQFTIMVDNRDEVRSKLEAKGIPTDIFYPKTIPVQPALKEYGFTEESFEVSRKLCERALALPIFPELTNAEQEQAALALIEILT